MDCPQEIDRNLLLDFRQGDDLGLSGMHDAGIIDEDIDPTMEIENSLDKHPPRFGIRYIVFDGIGFDPFMGQSLYGLVEAVFPEIRKNEDSSLAS